jgi:phospholipase/carboxylesterase
MNTTPSLDFLEAPPLGGQEPKILLVLLHGLGADKHDLMTLAEPLQMFIKPATRVVSPDAPFPCSLAPVGKQWFSMEDPKPEELVNGVRDAAPYLRQFLVEQAAFSNLSIRNTIILGFSQGGIMALHVALRLESNALGIICLSGGLIEDERITGELSAQPQILMCHGKDDNVVPLAVAEETIKILKPAGIPIELETFNNLEHSIDDRVLARVGQFLNHITFSL